MKYPLNSSVFKGILTYILNLTWERSAVVLFTLLIASELVMFGVSKYLYDKLNEKTPIYIVCDEKNREEQVKELREYVASTTLNTKSIKTKTAPSKKTKKSTKKTKE